MAVYKQQLATGNAEPILGKIDYFFADGRKRNIQIKVTDYEKASERFMCVSDEFGVSTKRSRIYILLDTDNSFE